MGPQEWGVLLLGLASGTGVLAWLVRWGRTRTIAGVKYAEMEAARESRAWDGLLERVDKLETEISGLKRELRIERFVKHQYSGMANSTRMALIMKIMEVNEVLRGAGKPDRYDVAHETVRIIKQINESLADEAERMYHTAEQAIDAGYVHPGERRDAAAAAARQQSRPDPKAWSPASP
jgi:hypothetical protein